MIEIFQNKGFKPKESENKQNDKKKRELTPEELIFVLETTNAKPYKYINKGTKVKNLPKGYLQFENDGVLKIKNGEVVDIDKNKFIKAFDRTTGSRILKKIEEKKGDISTEELSKELELTPDYTKKEIRKLKKFGLLNAGILGEIRYNPNKYLITKIK